MPAKLNLTQEIESGNVAALLSALSEVDISIIQTQLNFGILPKTVAASLGVEKEFCEIVKNRVSSQLGFAIKKNLISKENAKKLSDAFEEGFSANV